MHADALLRSPLHLSTTAHYTTFLIPFFPSGPSSHLVHLRSWPEQQREHAVKAVCVVAWRAICHAGDVRGRVLQREQEIGKLAFIFVLGEGKQTA